MLMKLLEATKLGKWEGRYFQATLFSFLAFFSVATIRKLPMETLKVPEFHIAAYSWLTASPGLSHSQWEQLLLHGFQTDLKQRVSEFMALSCSMFCNTPDDGGGGDYRIHSGDSMG